MNTNDKFLTHAIDFVKQNQKPFTFRDFILLGYSQDNFNQLVHRNKDDILKIGKSKYFPKKLFESYTLYIPPFLTTPKHKLVRNQYQSSTTPTSYFTS